MIKKVDANQACGVLSRLLKNEEGNIIAILAAAVIPVIGLVGGGVDMSRIYLTQSRLQGACDAGALMGRKTMGVGTWAANSNAASTQANRIFDQNFQTGAYGTSGLTRSFAESGGNVTGTASVIVPMALMQVLGQESKEVEVTCQAELRIPNSDVMFVLDTTGSMGGTASGSSETKISGLRKAVKCFYEALAKQNITDITPADCGETVDPSATNTGNVQLRFGFVPYAVNVNVGRLLPLDYMADSWTYQSREASTTTDVNATAVYGTESAPTTVSTVTTPIADTAWTNTGKNITVNGVFYDWSSSTTSSECSALSVPPTSTTTTTGATEFVSQSPNTPVEPDSTLTKTYERDSSSSTRSYQRQFTANSDPKKKGTCRLQFRDTGQNIVTLTTRTTTPITWVRNTYFSGWTYKPVTFNVSSLKDTGSNSWRSSLQLPIGTDGANTTVGWNGCIEERQTFRGPDSDPSDDWSPIPSTALDMDIDLAPTTSNTASQWGPMLANAVWERYLVNTDWSGSKSRSSTRTTSNVWVGRNDGVDMVRPATYCPTEAKKYQTWSPTEFRNYVNSLTIDGNTYHDIGLLWGARIMSPTGIFAALNAPTNMTIERHMVFMTDGETNVVSDDYSAYGVHWYDRRQTPTGTAPTNSQLNSMTDARTAALCTAIKNKNINLWVVSYGNVDSATNDRLELCATPGKFFEATSVASLVTNFKQIAAEISALRLTQ
ncbi:MAG: pilus assembly protein TadG-related protein [Sphingorhabdus sp.]